MNTQQPNFPTSPFARLLADDGTTRSRGNLTRFVKDDEGLVTWITLVVISFLLIFAAMVFNSAHVVNRKIESQNCADAVAISSATWTARGMNSVSAANHLIGELNAIYVLHHALGGKFLDENSSSTENKTYKMMSQYGQLTAAYAAINVVGKPVVPRVERFRNKLREYPNSDVHSAIYAGMMTLKRKMVKAFAAHAAGNVTYFIGKQMLKSSFPPTVIAGGILMIAGAAVQLAAVLKQTQYFKEYLVLDALEAVAHGAKIIKTLIPPVIIALHYYQKGLRVACPAMSILAAHQIGGYHGGVGHVRGDFPDNFTMPEGADWTAALTQVFSELAEIAPLLPVAKEDTDNEKRSQMIRATYPWVTHWRKPIRDFLNNKWFGAPASNAADYYTRFTNLYANQASTWLRMPTNKKFKKHLHIQNYREWPHQEGNGENGKDILLFVIQDLNEDGIDKSNELWNRRGNEDFSKATDRADEIFCSIGFSKLPRPGTASNPFYRQSNPMGIICFAQSMIYNGNKQVAPSPTPGDGQPMLRTGWDTLQWVDNNSVEFPTDADMASLPKFKLNWQAKLTPVTGRKLIKTALTVIIEDPEMRNRLYRIPMIIALKNH